MFKIAKDEPTFFKHAKSKVKSNTWSDKEIEKIRPKLREHILLNEQNLLCAYCEKEIDDNPKNSNIDHFKLKAGHLFPEKTLDYNNLLVSCNTHGRCSNHKDKNIKSKSDYDNIVNPFIENPDSYFDYLITGDIVAIDKKAKTKTEYSISIFQLQSNALVESRLQVYEALKNIDNLSSDEICGIFPNYHSFIKIIYKRIKEK